MKTAVATPQRRQWCSTTGIAPILIVRKFLAMLLQNCRRLWVEQTSRQTRSLQKCTNTHKVKLNCTLAIDSERCRDVGQCSHVAMRLPREKNYPRWASLCLLCNMAMTTPRLSCTADPLSQPSSMVTHQASMDTADYRAAVAKFERCASLKTTASIPKH